MNALPHPARYRQPMVRDLAQLLLGQAPWHTGCELPHPRLLGTHGLTLLAEYQVATTRELEDMEVKRTRVWTFP